MLSMSAWLDPEGASLNVAVKHVLHMYNNDDHNDDDDDSFSSTLLNKKVKRKRR